MTLSQELSSRCDGVLPPPLSGCESNRKRPRDTDAIAENLRPYLETPHLVDGWITPQAVMLKDGRMLSTDYFQTAGGGLILRECLEPDHAESQRGLMRRFDAGERLDVSHLHTQAEQDTPKPDSMQP